VSALDTSVHSELATKATSDDVKTVDTKVVGVKTDLDATREDLKMARSEMGTLIARNHDEIDQLRRLGERDYVEFTIVGRNKPQKVGNVTVELKGINEKHNQFSAAVTIEDRRFERKPRHETSRSSSTSPARIFLRKSSSTGGQDTISGYLRSRRRIRKRRIRGGKVWQLIFRAAARGVCRARDEAGRTICPPFFRGAQVIFRIPVE